MLAFAVHMENFFNHNARRVLIRRVAFVVIDSACPIMAGAAGLYSLRMPLAIALHGFTVEYLPVRLWIRIVAESARARCSPGAE